MTHHPKSSRPVPGLQKGERNKLIFMGVLLVLVIFAFFAAQLQKEKYNQKDLGRIEDEPAFVESVAVDPFDASPLEGKFNDSSEEDRVLLSAELLDPFLHYTEGFGDAHFKALGAKDLDGEALAALRESPSAHRAEAYRVRGHLEDVKSRERPDGLTEFRGWLRLSDEEVIHFVVTDMMDRVILYDYVRIDGLFVKLYRREVHDGTMAEGPLVVGAKAVSSVKPCGLYDAKVLQDRLSHITDDTSRGTSGLDSLVLDTQWLLMNYATSPEAEAIDWANAPEFDNLTMTEVLKNGEKHRGKPFRVPISQSMGIWTENAGENPLRIDQVTAGWIGNTTWTNQAGVIRFIMPDAHPEVEDAELVVGHGFFLKNHGYEPRDGGIRLAPYFVLTNLEEFIPVESNLATYFLWGAAGVAVILLIIFPILLMRDRRQSEALQQNLVRRRQERRRKLAEQQST